MKAIFRTFLFSMLFASAGYYLSACCKAECLNAALYISFQNYTKAEADTIIVIGYKTNTNFTVQQDSNILIKPYAATDTTKTQDSYIVFPDKDFIIKVPSVNKEFKISDYVTVDQRCACENRKVPVLKSFKLNGIAHTDVYNFNLPR